MKVLMKPIEMVAWNDLKGVCKPVRFRIDGQVVKVGQVLHVDEEKFKAITTRIYRCQSVVNGRQMAYELKFELHNCKWFLFRM